QPTRLRVKSFIYVYSDVVSEPLLERKAAKIQAQINNYWNNRIPPTRTLTLSSVAGETLAFSYASLPPLSVAATGNPAADAAALALQWRSDPGYDAIGNAEAADGTSLVTFIDAATRVFADAPTNDAEIVESIPPADSSVGTYFTAPWESEWRAMGEIGDKYAPPRPHAPVDIVFEVEAEAYTFAADLDANARTREMNRLRE